MKEMKTFREYQRWTKETALYENPVMYPCLELGGEVGEVFNQVKKIYRDDNGIVSHVRKYDLEKELGDCMWALARLADDLDLDLEQIVELNVAKLEDRLARGKIRGSGDNR